MSSNLRTSTYEYGANAVYIAEMYEKYLQNPNSVDKSWQDYFRSFNDNPAALKKDFNGGAWGKPRSKVVGVAEAVDPKAAAAKGAAPAKPSNNNVSQEALDSIHAQMLIRAYRVRGHLIANIDPLGLAQRESHPELDIERYGFSDADMGKSIAVGGWLGHDKLTLAEIMAILTESYCGTFTVECGHIQNTDKRNWLHERIESTLGKPNLSKEEKKEILQQLVETVGFEEFLHKKFPGTKRFSCEGGDGLMPALNASVTRAAALGVQEVVLGMPHRGRLNVLTAFMGKPYVAMLSEFNGNLAMPDHINSSGDVKYHQGYSNDKTFGGKQVHLSLTSNPSHLETVNPVVCGKVRAKQDQLKDTNREKAMGILLHGDAAFCGQGVVTETLALSDLDDYTTGGTLHIVVNNQVGFTTAPKYGHKSPYPTDVAMMVQAPIFHVNGDDPEAIVLASHIAAEYRAAYKQDVVIDIWCYRKHGHNEGDEPRWTQPKMYEVIDAKPTTREVYGDRLVAEGTLTQEEFDGMKEAFYNRLDKDLAGSNSYKPEKADTLEGKWTGLKQAFDENANAKANGETAVKLKKLKEVGAKLVELPKEISVHKGVQKVYENRAKMIETGEGIDWAFGEALAMGTLLEEGKPIRFTGQDVLRGTFSHRHAGVWDQKTEEIYISLNHISKDQAKADISNSALSEYAVLGYEYGYSQAEPNALTLWEAQFGDFVNGAQIVIDQYITSAEIKWLRMSGLVMLLPHAYEGQGPEHSSARLERFLQNCAEDNVIVANCTTPANYFHILRRQLCRDFRKPLIMMSPKSLLRHKSAVSPLKDFAEGSSFHRVLGETEKVSKVRKVLLCSGKVYYDLIEERAKRNISDIAIVRVEQLYPFPASSIAEELKKYKGAEVVWVQEEPENMGAWTFVDRRIEKVLGSVDCKSKRPTYVGRPEAAATACGYMKVHKHQQEKLINEALA